MTMPENQDESNVDAAASDATDEASPPASVPRVWTVFLAVVLALVLTVAVQVAVVAALVSWRVAEGMDAQDAVQGLVEDLTTPAAFVLLGIPSQLAIGLAAFIPARLSPQPTLPRLGLVRPVLPGWGYVVLMVGALLPLALGVALAQLIALVIPPDSSASMLYDQMTLPWAVPFILFVALAPGFMEEFLFRGYVQTRLLQRWRPWVAILVTSTIFGLFHVTPHAIAAAFVIGLWIGVVAWRTGSVWPGVGCHAFINGVWNIWHVGERVWGFPETPPPILAVCGGGVVIACFVFSVWILWRQRDPVP